MTDKKKEQVCIMLKSDLKEKLKAVAVRSGRTLSGLCGWLLERALERELKDG